MILLYVAIFIALALWGADCYLCLKEVERDLKEYLGDLLVAHDACHYPMRVHYAATISAVKSIIRKNFKL